MGTCRRGGAPRADVCRFWSWGVTIPRVCGALATSAALARSWRWNPSGRPPSIALARGVARGSTPSRSPEPVLRRGSTPSLCLAPGQTKGSTPLSALLRGAGKGSAPLAKPVRRDRRGSTPSVHPTAGRRCPPARPRSRLPGKDNDTQANVPISQTAICSNFWSPHFATPF